MLEQSASSHLAASGDAGSWLHGDPSKGNHLKAKQNIPLTQLVLTLAYLQWRYQ